MGSLCTCTQRINEVYAFAWNSPGVQHTSTPGNPANVTKLGWVLQHARRALSYNEQFFVRGGKLGRAYGRACIQPKVKSFNLFQCI
mmetsp:Transcript_132446/g.234235  ORF Transcript_132446/g.234235 Transcript_132446/m.234235 type:complete len:86 (-) Transcript_132446:264-521(-)